MDLVHEAIVAFFFFQAEDGIRDYKVTGVQTCALPIWRPPRGGDRHGGREPGERDRSNPAAARIVEGAPPAVVLLDQRQARREDRRERSEERRVGKECRSRWSPDH